MLIKSHRDGFMHPVSSEITPQAVYRDRRELLKLMASGAAGAGACVVGLAPGLRPERPAGQAGAAAGGQVERRGGRDHGKGHRVQGRDELQQLL